MQFIGCHQDERIEAVVVQQLLHRRIAALHGVSIRNLLTAFSTGFSNGRQGHIRQMRQHSRMQLAEATYTCKPNAKRTHAARTRDKRCP